MRQPIEFIIAWVTIVTYRIIRDKYKEKKKLKVKDKEEDKEGEIKMF